MSAYTAYHRPWQTDPNPSLFDPSHQMYNYGLQGQTQLPQMVPPPPPMYPSLQLPTLSRAPVTAATGSSTPREMHTPSTASLKMMEAIHDVMGTGDQTDNNNFSTLNLSGISTVSKIMMVATPEPFSPEEAQDSEKSSQGSEKSSGDPIDVVAETQETP
jgi:hypothetical protein